MNNVVVLAIKIIYVHVDHKQALQLFSKKTFIFFKIAEGSRKTPMLH
jgi:hypothetical protein